jgi:hypothetical protein
MERSAPAGMTGAGRRVEPPCVSLGAADIRCAHEWGEACHGAVRGPNYTGLEVAGRFPKGYLGEIGFLRLCEAAGVRCVYTVQTTGRRSPTSEFLLFFSGVARPVEIKTAGQKIFKRFLVVVAQGIEPRTIYIGTRLLCHGDWLGMRAALEVECSGWLPGAMVAQLPTATFGQWGVWSHHCLLTELNDLGRLVRSADRGRIVLRGRAAELHLAEPAPLPTRAGIR